MQFTLHIPYEEVQPLRFGMVEADIVAILGPPGKKLRTRKGEHDLRYEDCSIRLASDSGQMVEIGFYPDADVLIDGINLFQSPQSYRTLLAKDGGTLEFAGVLFLPSYGITLTGFHDLNASERSVTAFVKGRLDHLLSRFQPFTE
jgi:hypothetical protein